MPQPVGGVFDVTLLEQRPGFISFSASGKGATVLFQNEAGGHRWQRIPPTEKRGRVQTSTVTVAVLEPFKAANVKISDSDLDIQTSRGSGPGGQHRNKTDSCVTVTHIPTGTSVRIDMRSQHQSKTMALNILKARLQEQSRSEHLRKREYDRQQQVGSGMRGDKVRTYRTQDDQVTDHRTGRKWRLSKWIKGEW